jgi:hypothetical protein
MTDLKNNVTDMQNMPKKIKMQNMPKICKNYAKHAK